MCRLWAFVSWVVILPTFGATKSHGMIQNVLMLGWVCLLLFTTRSQGNSASRSLVRPTLSQMGIGCSPLKAQYTVKPSLLLHSLHTCLLRWWLQDFAYDTMIKLHQKPGFAFTISTQQPQPLKSFHSASTTQGCKTLTKTDVELERSTNSSTRLWNNIPQCGHSSADTEYAYGVSRCPEPISDPRYFFPLKSNIGHDP